MKRHIFTLIISLISVSAIADPVNVYILSGQSNMQGGGQVTELNNSQRTRIPIAQFWNGKAFEPLTPG